MKQTDLKGVAWIGVGAVLIGLIFMIAGAVITGIAYTEITPPNYDENYDRYIGSNVPRLIGPFFLCFGLMTVLGTMGIIGYKLMNNSYEQVEKNSFRN